MIHRSAQIGFSRSAEAYERARPDYPAEAVDHLVAHLTPGARVLDLAAGTGKLTRPLLAAGLALWRLQALVAERITPSVSQVGNATPAVPSCQGNAP